MALRFLINIRLLISPKTQYTDNGMTQIRAELNRPNGNIENHNEFYLC